MKIAKLILRTLSISAIASLPIVSLTGAVATSPVLASANQFDVCAGELLEAGLGPGTSAKACAKAIEPKELSECVNRINFVTSLDARRSVQACLRVRRPVELANCVTEIDENTDSPDPASVLNYCHRSLLPNRFAECVIGLNREVPLAVGLALEVCIDAQDSPPAVRPAPSNTET